MPERPPVLTVLMTFDWLYVVVVLRKPANCRRETSTEGVQLQWTSSIEETGNLLEENLNLVSQALCIHGLP